VTDDPETDPISPERLPASRTAPELVAKLMRDVSDLFLAEGDLIRSEMNDKIEQLRVGVGKVAAGGIVILVALVVLADALVVAVAGMIGTGTPEADGTGWASLIVGSVFGAIGAFFVRSGTTDLNPRNLRPDRTRMQMRRDSALAREQMR